MNTKKTQRQHGSLVILLAHEPANPASRRKVLARLTDPELIAKAAQVALLAAGDRIDDRIERETQSATTPEQVVM